jgi:hypothetical protein
MVLPQISSVSIFSLRFMDKPCIAIAMPKEEGVLGPVETATLIYSRTALDGILEQMVLKQRFPVQAGHRILAIDVDLTGCDPGDLEEQVQRARDLLPDFPDTSFGHQFDILGGSHLHALFMDEVFELITDEEGYG